MATSVAGLHAGAQHHGGGLSVGHLAAALERGEALLIDVRESGERERDGAVTGAVPAPWGSLEFWEELTSAYYRVYRDPNAHVVLACASGERSARAAATLRQMRYANVTHLAGGFTAWLAANRSREGGTA
jgi:rhodanese-related sulfurtransferase